MHSLATELDALLERFQKDAAQGLDLSFQFELSDDEPFQLFISDQQCRIEQGTHPDPDITLSCDRETLASILSGELDGMQAFLAGDLQAEGDIALALKLSELFALDQSQEAF